MIDEVLSVGDAAFQRKCHGRIKALRDDGAAIFLVTHNAWVVPLVCEQAMFLDNGKVVAAGDPVGVLARYGGRGKSYRTDASGGDLARIEEVVLTPTVIDPSEPVSVEVTVDVLAPMPDGHLHLGIAGGDQAVEAGVSSQHHQISLAMPGRRRFRITLAGVHLSPGPYSVLVTLFSHVQSPVAEDQRQVPLHVRGEERDRPTYGVVALNAAWQELDGA